MDFSTKVDEYIANKPQWAPTLTALRKIIATTELQEHIKWGMPVYTFGGKNVVGLGAFKNHAGIWFFQGALLSDPLQALSNAQEGKTKAMRQWRFHSLEEIPPEQVKSYLDEAIGNEKKGLKIKPGQPRHKPLKIPPELAQRFEEDKKTQNLFSTLTLSRKREFCEYISEAKRPDTRSQRLEKVVALIKKKTGLYDKYKS